MPPRLSTAADQDFVVELRGFEPLTSAVQAPARLTGSSLPFVGGSSATSRQLEPALAQRLFQRPASPAPRTSRRSRRERPGCRSRPQSAARSHRRRADRARGPAPGCDLDAALLELRAAGWGRWSLGGRWRLRERRGRDLAANASGPPIKAMGKAPMRQMPRFLATDASGASVDQVDCLVRADIEIGHIRRLTVGVFPAQIHVTILALRYFSPRPLAGFQRA
jgi:hypothetical protein